LKFFDFDPRKIKNFQDFKFAPNLRGGGEALIQIPNSGQIIFSPLACPAKMRGPPKALIEIRNLGQIIF
jgi:hypothetical protein